MNALTNHLANIRAVANTLAASAVVLSAAFGATGANASLLDFDMVNQTNQPIVGLWASPASSGTWGRPFTNTFVPDSGGRQSVRFNGTESSCWYDVRVQFAKGEVRYWNNLNLCAISGMRVYVAPNGAVTAATW